MKKKILATVFFFLLITPLYAQHYRVGAGFIAGLPNDNLKLSGGFDLFVEYKTESQFLFRTEGGFAVSKFKDANPYISDINYSLYWLEGSLVYLPIRSEYEPFIGGGIGYYFIAHEDFNQLKTFTGEFNPQKLSNKFSYHAKVGFIYPLSKSFKLQIQAKYLWLDRKIIVQSEEIIDEELNRNTAEEDLDLSTVYLTLGVVIKI